MMDQANFSFPVELKQVRITDDFWEKEIRLVREQVVPYQWEALNDRVPDAEPSYCIHNFKAAGKLNEQAKNKDFVRPVYSVERFQHLPEDPEKPEETRFYGFVFQDSDYAKWIEAVAYLLEQQPDPELERIADESIDIVCAAQQPDGYLDTFYILNDLSKRFTNLKDYHELYCMGHLIEGAVAYYKATAKRKLLDAACRYADCVAEHIGPEEGKLRGYPGHEVAEMALAKLYELTGEERFLRLGQYFLDERGREPCYFDLEHQLKPDGGRRNRYYQAHKPVREQEEAVGHAVRAVYLYSGMADFARLTGDESLKTACRRLWKDIVERKMYLTGGIGATHIGEAFSFAYDLPNDTAYAETCAAIGMAFFARRMLELEADSEYGDVLEREIYNGALSGMDFSGTRFFYVNPLEVLPEACREDSRKEHVQPVRQKWFGCSCCPPNLARLIGSIGSYVYTQREDAVFVHLYIGSRLEKQLKTGSLRLEMESWFPWEGKVRLKIECDATEPCTVALRMPGWCGDCRVKGAEDAQRRQEKGYLYLTKVWGSEILELDFPMEARLVQADSRVREDIGKAAVMRGPLVYCMEQADNGENLHLLRLEPEAGFTACSLEIAGRQVLALKGKGWRQRPTEGQRLYSVYTRPQFDPVSLTWVPYYAWANRGEGEMQVWSRI